MSRTNNSCARKSRHKAITTLAKGYRGRSNNCFRLAKRRVEKALQYSYRDRRNKKRDFRALWIQRINAVARQYDMKYSVFIYYFKKLQKNINRKVLSEVFFHKPEAFLKIKEYINEQRSSKT